MQRNLIENTNHYVMPLINTVLKTFKIELIETVESDKIAYEQENYRKYAIQERPKTMNRINTKFDM